MLLRRIKDEGILKLSTICLTQVLEPHLSISLSVLGSLLRSKSRPNKYYGADVSLIVKPFTQMEPKT